MMTEVLQHAFTMPTTVFSALLGFVVLYWAASMLGVFSFEMLEGLGDAVDGLADAADAVDAADGGGGFFDKVGLGEIPRAITWSLTIVFGWLASMAMSFYVPGYRALVMKGIWAAGIFGAVSLALAFGATLLAVQPLRKVMVAGYGQQRSDLVSKLCTVRTGRVDEDFGQAEVEGGSALVQVRTRFAGEHTFHRGAKAVIDEYDAEREVFYISPVQDEVA